MRPFTCAILALLLSLAAFGQASANQPDNRPTGVTFEVASVKPVLNLPPPGGGCAMSMRVDPGRVDFQCTTLDMLIGYAFRVLPDRVNGPDWMMATRSPRFNIVASIPAGTSKSQVREMVQSLLAERFKLVVRRATASQPVYALVMAKGGLKIKEAASKDSGGGPSSDSDATAGVDDYYEYYGNVESLNTASAGSVTTVTNPRMGMVRQRGEPYRAQRWEATNISFAGLADLLNRVAPLSLPVIDMTRSGGRYQLVLEVSLSDLPGARERNLGTPGAAAAADDPPADIEEIVLKAFNTGLQKLGLRLEPRKAPLETIVVDRVEKTPTEN